jgi:hypothetical protein
MGKGLAIFLGIFGVSVVGLIVLALAIMGVTNGFVRAENGIKAQYSENQSNYDKMFKSFRESAQVTDMYKNDIGDVFKKAIDARYGDEGSKALFQMIKEQNPNFDSTLYNRLQAMIEANRNSFDATQKAMAERCRVYRDDFEQNPNALIASFFGYPKIDMKTYCTVVTSGRTEKAFDTKKDEEIKLR